MELLPLHEAPYAGDKVRTLPIARMDHQLETGAAQRIEDALLAVDNILGDRIVIHQADQKRAAEGEPPRLRIGGVANLLDNRVDPRARLAVYERRLIDHPGDRLLRDPGKARDIVDGRAMSSYPVARQLRRRSSTRSRYQPGPLRWGARFDLDH